MRGNVNPDSLLLDSKIEKTAKRLTKKAKAREQVEKETKMAEENENQNAMRTLEEYATLSANGYASSITRPPIQANSFELKPALLQLVQKDQFG